jgi:hypothetical protein
MPDAHGFADVVAALQLMAERARQTGRRHEKGPRIGGPFCVEGRPDQFGRLRA